MFGVKIIETSRTYIREFVSADAGCLASILSDVRAMTYAPMAATADISVASAFIEWHRKNYATHGYSAWAVILKDGDVFAGQAGLLPHESDVELFFSFLPEFWGRGLATEVALACRDHAFTGLGLDRLLSVIHPKNQSAIAVAAKVGMRHNGSIRMWERDNALYEIQRTG
jgi:RimJ/RimL family protein N-acetyltransferase